jgi:acetate kinase
MHSLLTINGGSSSIKFAVFLATASPARVLTGQVDRIGSSGTRITSKRSDSGASDSRPIDASDHHAAAAHLIDYLRNRTSSPIVGVGHRVVHGGLHLLDHQLVTPALIAELRRNQPLDLAHLPREIALIEAFHTAFPDIPQIACFDTAFHRDMPRVAQLLPIPRHYADAGVRRFGFHGLSYSYLLSKLEELAGREAAHRKIILAHLGSGASMAAVRDGKPIDTTMSFTPTAGLVMGTRPGDLDPGLLVYMTRVQRMSPDQMDHFISHDCGLKGISGTTSDMVDLVAKRSTDSRAAEAVELFCYQARKFIGALATTLGGLDTLVFSGGIGEHAAEIRDEICRNLNFLGIVIDAARNTSHADVISTDHSRATVRVIATDEEVVIARAIVELMNRQKKD